MVQVHTFSRAAAGLAAALALLGALPSPADAQRRNQEQEEPVDESRVFSPDIGELVVRGQEQSDAGQLDAAKATYERALANPDASRYERGIILQLLGALAYEQDRTLDAAGLFERALNEGNLLPAERLSLLNNVGSLYLASENYAKAVEFLERWIAEGGQARDTQYLNMVFAYSELGRYQDALRYARRAFEVASPKERKHYDTLNFLYTELNMPVERAAILQEMVQLYPTDKNIWNSIAALYAAGGEEDKAFEIRKIMYLNGMVTEGREIEQLVDYYSFLDVPYRGARIYEREMNRGRIEQNRQSLEKLARLYRQARDFEAAIPPLTRAAEASNDGKLWQQLGEAYYAEGKLAEAEDALGKAIARGIDRPGNAWSVIGSVRYERGQRQGAIEAFQQAVRFPYSSSQARGWISFIEGEIAAEQKRREFEEAVAADEIRVACERRRRGTDIIDSGPVLDARTGQAVDCEAVLGPEVEEDAGESEAPAPTP